MRRTNYMKLKIILAREMTILLGDDLGIIVTHYERDQFLMEKTQL